MKMEDTLPFLEECLILRGFPAARRYSRIFAFQHLPIQIPRRPVRSLARVLIIQNCLPRPAVCFCSARNKTERVARLVTRLSWLVERTYVEATRFDHFSQTLSSYELVNSLADFNANFKSTSARVSISLLT